MNSKPKVDRVRTVREYKPFSFRQINGESKVVLVEEWAVYVGKWRRGRHGNAKDARNDARTWRKVLRYRAKRDAAAATAIRGGTHSWL